MNLEIDIKSKMLNFLMDKEKINSSDIIINEFTFGNFSRRVDLSLIKNNELFAIEIKSESDNLNRLHGQIEDYLKVFDKVIVVLASKHLVNGLTTLPNQVEILEYTPQRIKTIRRGKKKIIKEKQVFIDLMRVSELIKLSNELKEKPRSRNRNILSEEIHSLPLKKIRATALKSLKSRFKDSSNLFFQRTKGREIKNEDIKILSNNKKKEEESLLRILENINRSLI